MKKNDYLLEFKNVSLYYGSVRALHNINFNIYKGEIHALVGEHGAGKSSLAGIISGEIQRSEGSIIVNNKNIYNYNIHRALTLGIKAVYQDILLNDYFSVAESLFYSNKVANKHIWISKKKMLQKASQILSENGFQINPKTKIINLNLSDRTVVDILRCLVNDTKLLVIDEGLDNLSTDYYLKIIKMLHNFKRNGLTILFITHKIDDVFSLADRVTIIRDGTILGTHDINNIDKLNLVRLTYTQVSKGDININTENEFYSFIKYNEAILKNLPLSLIVLDSEKKIKFLNNACKSLLNWNDTDINVFFEKKFNKKNIELFSLLNQSFQKKEEANYFHVRIELENNYIITNFQTLPIKDNGSIIGYIIILEDVTEYEKMQKQLVMSEKLASVGLLAAGVAHEINNPLEIIYNYLTYLRYNYAEENLLSIINNISEEIMIISGIISNLVSFSNNSSLNIEPVDINELIKDILKLIKFNANYRSINISFYDTDNIPKIMINRNELRQVLLNIIKNSIEAINGTGNIIISTLINITNNNKYVEISIKDDGKGLDPKEINNIFMPFYSTKDKNLKNLGLGLSISYSIIEKYKGSITAHNNNDKGSTFIVSIPYNDNE